MQYGNLVPLPLFLITGLTALGRSLDPAHAFQRLHECADVVIGGQAISLTFDGYMHYVLFIFPMTGSPSKKGLGGAVSIFVVPFVLFYFISKGFPVFDEARQSL